MGQRGGERGDGVRHKSRSDHGPSGTVNRGGGLEGVQLGDRGLLGGAQLAARVLAALKHTNGHERGHAHKHERIRTSVQKEMHGSF